MVFSIFGLCFVVFGVGLNICTALNKIAANIKETSKYRVTIPTIPCEAYSALVGKVCAVTGKTCTSRCGIS